MTNPQLAPNELADLYDGLFTLLEELPDNNHPGWAFAIESVIFGGEGLHPETPCYGKQQAERNEFAMRDYREQYGDGGHVTEFPAIETETIGPADVPGLNREIVVPVEPNSGSRLPVRVGNKGLRDAIEVLAQLPAEPAANHPPDGHHRLLNPRRFPILVSGDRPPSTVPNAEAEDSPAESAVNPNELAEVYDGLLQLYQQLPDDGHPVWQEAIETMLFGGEFLYPGRTYYGEQQAERNHFSMKTYRDVFGDGERVTSFSIVDVTTQTAGDCSRQIFQAPASGDTLPVAPTQSELPAALALLAEFPAKPSAEDGDRSDNDLLFFDGLLEKAGIERSAFEHAAGQAETGSRPDITDTNTTERADSSPTEGEESTAESASTGNDGETTLLSQDPGESNTPLTKPPTDSDSADLKYDDPRAQRAHEAAQRRHPSEVVEKGGEIELVLKEVDYTYTEPTIMGKKNDLVVFVEEAPQDLSRFDVIYARVIGYGAGNTCAKAVFTGYAD